MRRVQSNTLDVGIDVHLKNWSTAILSKHSVLRRFLQVDCEGPTLISYIVAKHLAHASRHNLTLPYKRFRIRRFRNLYVFAYKDEITLDTPLSEEPRPQQHSEERHAYNANTLSEYLPTPKPYLSVFHISANLKSESSLSSNISIYTYASVCDTIGLMESADSSCLHI